MTTLLTLPHLRIHLHTEARKTIELEWLDFTPSSELRQSALQALALATEHHVQSWLSNDTSLGAVRPRDLEWAQEAILGALAQLGLQHYAIVESQDSLNRLTIGTMYERMQAQLPYPIRCFSSLAEARAWATNSAG